MSRITPMPADAESAPTSAAREHLEALLAAEMLKARNEMRVIRGMWLFSGLALVIAILLWTLAGGREQFITRDSGYDATVLLPGWLALAGLLAAGTATVLFMIRLMRATLGNIEERQARK